MSNTRKQQLYDSIMKAIEKEVRTVIYEETTPLSEYFDLDSVSEEDIHYVLNNNWYNTIVDVFNNPLLNESLLDGDDNKTYQPDYVIKQIEQKYRTLKWQITKSELHDRKTALIIIEPERYSYADEIINDMDKLGYFLCRVENGMYIGQSWKLMSFEPKEQPDIRTEITKYTKIYHVTPASNLLSILKNGFIPKSSDNTEYSFAYPSRVYLMTASDMSVIRKLACTLFFRNKSPQEIQEADDRYAIIRLDIDKIPDNIHMFYDSCCEDAIFVRDNIPASAIKNITLFSCRSKKEIKYSFWNKIVDKIKAKFL